MRWPFLLTTDKWPESKRDMADNFFCVWLYGAAVTFAVVGDSPPDQPSNLLLYYYVAILPLHVNQLRKEFPHILEKQVRHKTA